MDPLSALAVATAAAQFLDFGTSLVSGTLERYQAVAGATENHVDIESVASRLRDLISNLQPPTQEEPESPASVSKINPRHGRRLQTIIKNCQDAVDQLLALLAELKATGRYKLVGSLLATAKAIRKEKKVQQLHQKLLSTQSELSLCLVSLVYDNQNTISYTLGKLEQSTRNDKLEEKERLREGEIWQSSIVAALDDLLEQSHALKLHSSTTLWSLTRQLERHLETSLATKEIMQDTQQTLIHLSKEAQVRRSQLKVLESLMDPVIKIRESSIHEAHADTYGWMLLPGTQSEYPDVQFWEWLTGGTGVFWIAGKPGCGKSTLMKFVYSAKETRAALDLWADGSRLVLGGHFFWIAGYDLQRSQDGLLRSLLYTILAECPYLMTAVIPGRWGQNSLKHGHLWARTDLLDSLKRFSALPITDTKFCFFIDALDEYSDSHDELADIIAMLCSKSNIKICLSSREWPVFEHYFGEERELSSLPVRKIRLQLYTRDDIREYAESRLERNPRYQRLQTIELEQSLAQQKEVLVAEIIDRAEGVFLWVSLVCDELLRGFTNLDSLDTLYVRLRGLPTDLEQFFLKMIERVEPVYHAQCAQILQLLFASKRPIPTRLLDFITGDPAFGIRDGLALLPDTDETRIVQLKARCADLIEFVKHENPTWKFGPEVTFMHRTVRDFLMTPPIQSFLVAKLPAGFDVNSYMSQALVTQMRLAWRMGVIFAPRDARVIVEDIAHHVRKLEQQSSETFDLINKFLPQIPYFFLASVIDIRPYIPPESPKAERDRFAALIFTISHGLHTYVTRQLEADPDLLKLVPSQDPLLHCALRGVLGPDPGSGSGNDPKAILETVRVILSRGASPNSACAFGGTPWTHLVAAVRNGSKEDNDKRAEIVAALIEAGACDHIFDQRTRLDLRNFSLPQQRRLAFVLQNARARRLAAWHTRHFMCFPTFALAMVRRFIFQFISRVRPRITLYRAVGAFMFLSAQGCIFTAGYSPLPASVVLNPEATAAEQGISRLSSALSDTQLAIVLMVSSTFSFLGLSLLLFGDGLNKWRKRRSKYAKRD